jgi:hypothetical protein
MKAIQLIPTIVLGLVISGLVVVAGVKVIANFRSNTVDNLATKTATSEDQTASAAGIITLTYSTSTIIKSVDTVTAARVAGIFETLNVTEDYNSSVGYFGSGLVTLSPNYYNNETNVTYTYSVKEAVLNATEDTMKGTTEISNQFGTIGIIAAMVVILMMIGGLTAYFGLR